MAKKAKKMTSARKIKKPRVKAVRARKPTGSAKRAAPKKRKAGSRAAAGSAMTKIGEVTHYFPHVNAAAVKILKQSLKVGDSIHIKGHTSDFKEKVQSIQLDHCPVQEGKKGQEIGLFVKSRVRIGDDVYKLEK